MLDTAMGLMQRGLIPSVSDVAEAAEVSRATAYRYFPSQAALIQETVDEALGPILEWTSESDDAEERVSELFTFAYPRIEEYEATPPRGAAARPRSMDAPPGGHARRRGAASSAGIAGRCSPRRHAAVEAPARPAGI